MMKVEEGAALDEKFVSSSHSQSCLANMQDMLEVQKLTDVTLVTAHGDVEIKAHRLVLASASDYFKAMFVSDLLEAKSSQVLMEDMDSKALEALVKFCYSGEIRISEDNVETILSTANVLQIKEVVKACCDFLVSRLDPSNCIGFALFADAQGCIELYQASNSYIMDHFTEVVLHQEYLVLSAEEVRKLLSNDMLNVPCEEVTFNSLINWINYDVENRKKNLCTLLETIKLPLLSPQFLTDSIETNPLFKESQDCYNLIMEAMKYHLLPERRFSLMSARTRPRKSTVGDLYVIGGTDGAKGTPSIYKYSMRHNDWTNYGNMTSRKLQFGSAVIDNKLYVVGGRDGLKTLNVVECYDFQSKTWSGLPCMSTHRHGLGVAVLGGQMYAVGGHDGWTYLNTVERWDPTSRQWSYVAPLNKQRSTVSVAVLNDRLYAVGGRDGSSCLRAVECFDPHRNKWTFCAPMSTRRGAAGIGVINGYLFVLGGHDAPFLNPGVTRFDTVERYDPRTDTWTAVASLSIGRDSIGVGVLGDNLIAIGGYDGQVYSKIVESYDPQSNEWEELKELPEGRASMCVAVVKNS